MSGIRPNLDGPYAQGVVNPYTAHVHPYPTRYHGGIYTRPVFGLPYVRSPHAVFKPNDFYEFYGQKGLGSIGSFARSSLGNGALGGNTLGLGATGTPIYWHTSNPKTLQLQTAVNTVLEANRFGRPLLEDSKLGAQTCAGLAICSVSFKADLLAKVSQELIAEVTKVCESKMSDSTIAAQMKAEGQKMVDARKPVPEPVVTQPTSTTVVESPVANEQTIVQQATTPPATAIKFGVINTKVETLQRGINRVFAAKRFKPISVTKKLDTNTCAALAICNQIFKLDLFALVPPAIVVEVTELYLAKYRADSAWALKLKGVIELMYAQHDAIVAAAKAAAAKAAALKAATEQSAAAAKAAADAAATALKEAATAAAAAAKREAEVLSLPDMEITAAPPTQKHDNRGLILVAVGVVALGGIGYYLATK